MPRFASIDCGSNSFLMLVAEPDGQGGFRTVEDRMEIPRLGEGLQRSGVISAAAQERGLAVLERFAGRTQALEVDAVAAVGTMCLRNASNAQEFVAEARRRCGIEIEVIPGEAEARLSYLAARADLSPDLQRPVVFDVGGGSTEFIFGAGTEVQRRCSLDVGSIRLREEFLLSDPVSVAELQRLQAHLQDELGRLQFGAGLDLVVGMGGTLTTLASLQLELEPYDAARVQGLRLRRAELDAQIERLRSRTLAERRRLPGLDPKRADVILAGACIVQAALSRSELDELQICARGIRHGLLAERFAQPERRY